MFEAFKEPVKDNNKMKMSEILKETTKYDNIRMQWSANIWEFMEFMRKLLRETPKFTGKLEINFKDGLLKDINKTERTKF